MTAFISEVDGSFRPAFLNVLRDVGGTMLPRLLSPAFASMQWRLSNSATAEGSKVAALTFDDGPHPEGTPELLDVLSKAGVPATHFVLGCHVERYPDLAKRILAEGHVLGNHSWSHQSGWDVSLPELVREFRRTDELLRSISGDVVRWVRPPYGKFTYRLIHWARRRDQRVVMWDTMPPDFSARADVAYLSRVISRMRSRSIVCLHDNDSSRRHTPAMLREMLPRLIDDGWRFVPLQ